MGRLIMGWQDRDYAKATPGYVRVRRTGGGGLLGGRSIVTTLIIINAVVFVLCTISGQGGFVLHSPVFQFGAMFSPAVIHGQIWRLITADYLHWSFGHILMNMIGLHFLGRPLEREWGARKFLAVYTIAGLLGSVFYLFLCLMAWLPMESVAAGASGCVLALLGACAVRYPHAQLWIYFLFPIKIRTAALIFAGWYVLNLFSRGPNAGGDACHLAGLLFGAWWAMKGDAWWAARAARAHAAGQTRWAGAQSVRKTKARSKPRTFAAKVAQRRADEETIDRILKKVYDRGIHSLTEAEKQALQDATERQRQREEEAGRVDRL